MVQKTKLVDLRLLDTKSFKSPFTDVINLILELRHYVSTEFNFLSAFYVIMLR